MDMKPGSVQEEAVPLFHGIWNRSLLQMITACGSTIEKDGKRLFNKEMTPEIAKLSVEVLRKYGLIPVMEGADYMYYDKDEYTDEVNWYASLITEALGDKWRPIRGNEDCMQINKISAKMTAAAMQRLHLPS